MTPEQRAKFDRDGYLVVHDHLVPEALDFACAFSRLRDYMPHADNGELYDAAWLMPEFLRIAGHMDTQETVNQLLGRPLYDPLYLYNGRCLIQPPGDFSHCWDWHQEVFHSVPHTRAVQTWAPLICDATEENGAIEVLPGSHREGIANQTWTDEGTGYALVSQDVVSKYAPVTLPLPVGSMLFFSNRLVHRSGHNHSSQNRYAAVGVYTDVGVGFRAPKPMMAWRGASPREALQEAMRDA